VEELFFAMSKFKPWRESQKSDDKIFLKVLESCPLLKDK
jgi:hypothetical protein